MFSHVIQRGEMFPPPAMLPLSAPLRPCLGGCSVETRGAAREKNLADLRIMYAASMRRARVLAQVRWVDESDMGGCGITTGMKKVLALASKARGSGGAGPGPPAAKKQGRETESVVGRKTKKKRKEEEKT